MLLDSSSNGSFLKQINMAVQAIQIHTQSKEATKGIVEVPKEIGATKVVRGPTNNNQGNWNNQPTNFQAQGGHAMPRDSPGFQQQQGNLSNNENNPRERVHAIIAKFEGNLEDASLATKKDDLKEEGKGSTIEAENERRGEIKQEEDEKEPLLAKSKDKKEEKVQTKE